MQIPKRIDSVDENIKEMLFKAYIKERWAFSAMYIACANRKILADLLAYWRLLCNSKDLKKKDFARYRTVLKHATQPASKHKSPIKNKKEENKETKSVSTRVPHTRSRIHKSPYTGTMCLDERGEKLVRNFINNDYSESNVQKTIRHFSETYKTTELLRYIQKIEKKYHKREHTKLAKDIKNKSKRLNSYTSSDSRNHIQLQDSISDNIKEKKTIVVPWNAIEFKDGSIHIYNFRLNGEIILKRKPHIIVSCRESKACFNEIKQYILSKLPDIVVTVKDNNIESLITEIDLKKAIRILDESQYSSETDKKVSPFIIPASYNSARMIESNRILRYLKRKKSSYLNYLANQQEDDKKIIPCSEFFCYDNVEYEEDAFIFSLAYTSNYYKLVFENVKASRASIVFILRRDDYEKGIQGVFEFMRSDYLNKRQCLHYKSFDLSKYGIFTYRCLNHDYFEDWKYRLQH